MQMDGRTELRDGLLRPALENREENEVVVIRIEVIIILIPWNAGWRRRWQVFAGTEP